MPSAHPYVAHLGGDGVARLPDPVPAGASGGRWWPPVALQSAWIARHAGSFDLLHVHFGTEAFTPAELGATVAALRGAGRPLVLTVHDLAHPQLADPDAHLDGLGVLVRAAARLLTLTPGAAARIRQRWGREATVIAHPHVLPLGRPAPVGRRRGRRVIGVHLRDLRPNVDGPGTVRTLLEAVRPLRAEGLRVEVRVELHDTVRDASARHAVRALCADRHATLVEGPRPEDGELEAALADLDVCVLPYRHGTHSGWLELCWDLAVPVAAPRVGHFAEQHADGVASWTPGDPSSLTEALRRLLDEGPAPGSAAQRTRQAQRRQARRRAAPGIAAAHRDCYAALLF